jgi:hypothetical protein
MQKYYNDFFILTVPPSNPFVPGGNLNYTAEVDINNFNTITFINLNARLIKLPNTGPDLETGFILFLNRRYTFEGNKNEIHTGSIQVLFLNSALPGRLLVIRKKYI